MERRNSKSALRITELYKMMARLIPIEIHADMNAGISLVELLQEIDKREAEYEE
jgi:hypothetical protein